MNIPQYVLRLGVGAVLGAGLFTYYAINNTPPPLNETDTSRSYFLHFNPPIKVNPNCVNQAMVIVEEGIEKIINSDVVIHQFVKNDKLDLITIRPEEYGIKFEGDVRSHVNYCQR